MKPRIEITADMLREHLNYDPKTGVFTRKIATKKSKVGDFVGALNGAGYVDICIFRMAFPAHRLAWLYMTGEMPAHVIDHINRVRHENYIAAGVKKAQASTEWTASIFVGGEFRFLGGFATEEEAKQVFRDAMREAYPDKRNHDKPIPFCGYVPKIRRPIDAYLRKSQ